MDDVYMATMLAVAALAAAVFATAALSLDRIHVTEGISLPVPRIMMQNIPNPPPSLPLRPSPSQSPTLMPSTCSSESILKQSSLPKPTPAFSSPPTGAMDTSLVIKSLTNDQIRRARASKRAARRLTRRNANLLETAESSCLTIHSRRHDVLQNPRVRAAYRKAQHTGIDTLSPLRVLALLKELDCAGRAMAEGTRADLISPLGVQRCDDDIDEHQRSNIVSFPGDIIIINKATKAKQIALDEDATFLIGLYGPTGGSEQSAFMGCWQRKTRCQQMRRTAQAVEQKQKMKRSSIVP